MHIVILKNYFSAISSIIIFVICRSAKECVHGEVHEENAVANVCLNPNNVWKWEIISTVSDRNFIIFWQMEQVCFFFVFFWYILFILSFGCVTIVNREMKSVSAI